jgi:hypothetical protein
MVFHYFCLYCSTYYQYYFMNDAFPAIVSSLNHNETKYLMLNYNVLCV